MNWKECGRKQLRTTLMYCPSISLEEYRKNTKISLRTVTVLAKTANRSITSRVKLLNPTNCDEKLYEPTACTLRLGPKVHDGFNT
jgi:hypothetical protein